MVRIPTEEELGFTSVRADRPPALVSRGEAQQIEAPGQALEGLGGAVSQFGAVLQHQKEQDDHYNATKDLIELQRTQERSLDEAHRDMTPGGAGFADNWRQSYDDAASQAGQQAKARGYSPKVLADLDTRLVKVGEVLHTRAWHQELAERDRFHTEDVTNQLNRIVDSDIATKPDSVQVQIAKGQALIDASRLSAVQRTKISRAFPAMAEDAAWRARLANGDNPQDILRDLKLRPPGTDASPDGTPSGAAGEAIERHSDGMATVKTVSGAAFRVAGDHADRFAGALADLEAAGVAVKPEQSGGYNPRNIRGTNTPSEHASGRAIDVNWTDNAQGTQGALDPDLARSIAQKWGLKWGGDFAKPDPMHFEVAKDAKPLPKRADPEAPNAEGDPSDGGVRIPGEPTERDLVTSPDAPYRHMTAKQRLTAIRVVTTAQRATDQTALDNYIETLSRGETPQPGADGQDAWQRAQATLTEKQKAVAASKIQVARSLGEARTELPNLASGDYPEFLSKYQPDLRDPEEAVKAKADAVRKIEAEWKKADDLRKRDPSKGVEGSDEVKAARELIANAAGPAQSSAALGTNEAGEAAPGPPVTTKGVGLSPQRQWAEIFKARVAAQARMLDVGHPEDAIILDRAEAKRLLDMPANPNTLSEKAYRDRLNAAADRAHEAFEPWADQAMKSAIQLQIKGKPFDDAASGKLADMMRKSARGGPILEQDVRDLMSLQSIDKIGRLFETPTASPDSSYSGPAITNAPGSPSVEAAQSAMAASAEANRKPSDKIIDWLKRNPDQWPRFDQEYGRGAAAQILTKPKKKGFFE